MENYLELIANDNESNADAILNEISLTEFLDDANDVSINSYGDIVEGRTAAVATTSKPWTIQNSSNKYIEKIEYRRTTFTKKWKTLKSQAEALASQTGVEIKAVIYNPDNKKAVNSPYVKYNRNERTGLSDQNDTTSSIQIPHSSTTSRLLLECNNCTITSNIKPHNVT